MTDNNGATYENGSKFHVTEQVFDHFTDAIAALGIAFVAFVGAADPTVIAGLVSIALGKRYMKR